VAIHAFFKVSNAFFKMFRSNSVRLMFVAAVAGISVKLVFGVARRASRFMIAIEEEKLVMVERRRLPPLGAMALPAAAFHLAMESVDRRLMTGLAAIQCGFRKQRMVEQGWLPVV
jgi:hypothetical protein